MSALIHSFFHHHKNRMTRHRTDDRCFAKCYTSTPSDQRRDRHPEPTVGVTTCRCPHHQSQVRSENFRAQLAQPLQEDDLDNNLKSWGEVTVRVLGQEHVYNWPKVPEYGLSLTMNYFAASVRYFWLLSCLACLYSTLTCLFGCVGMTIDYHPGIRRNIYDVFKEYFDFLGYDLEYKK